VLPIVQPLLASSTSLHEDNNARLQESKSKNQEQEKNEQAAA
jgi:hypothetical protein